MTTNFLPPILRFCLLAVAMFAASTQSQAQPQAPAQTNLPGGVAVRVNGVAISDGKLAQAIKESGAPDSPQLRQIMKSQLIARELFRQEAAKNKSYDKRPEVRQAMQDAHDAAVSRLYLRDALKPEPVTDVQVRAKFDDIVASLGDKEYKASIIQVADEATAQTVLARLKKNGADFAQLAQQYSQAPNRVRGGELGWISFKQPLQEGQTQNLPLPLAQAIVRLPDGGVSAEPVVWNKAWYLVRLDQSRPTQVPKYDEVQGVLRQQLEAQALEKATAALMVRLIQAARIEQ